MGRDKTLLEVGGAPLAGRAASALAGAGVARVTCIGGDLTRLAGRGLDAIPDDHPGQGPLGGILTALRSTDADVLVVLAGDLATPDAAAVATVIAAVTPGVDLAVPVLDGRHQWLHTAWLVATARPALAAAFDRGERAVHRAVVDLHIHRITSAALADIDTPEDLRRVVAPGELP
jgi:molybdopterin-guanine dinucleotide biosynthesis protein A